MIPFVAPMSKRKSVIPSSSIPKEFAFVADGLSITTRERIGIASVMARKGVDAIAVGSRLGMDLPTEPRAVFWVPEP